MNDDDPNLWNPTPEQQFREAAERIVAPALTRSALLDIMSDQVAKWKFRAKQCSTKEFGCDPMPPNIAYQLLADQAAMFLDLLKRTK